MEVRHFEDKDIKEAGRLAYEYWSGELPDNGEAIKRVIYEYMVRYYDRNRTLSFSITDKGVLKGFILAFRKNDSATGSDWLSSELSKFSMPEQELALEYDDYYQYNGTKTKELIGMNDTVVGLFVSAQRGCGKKLLARLLDTCKLNSIQNLYLWTDMSCNYNYYYCNNFEEVTRFETTDLFGGERLEMIIFRKSTDGR